MTRRLVVSALLLALSAFAQDGKPNFSGTWKLNAAKSDFGPMIASRRAMAFEFAGLR